MNPDPVLSFWFGPPGSTAQIVARQRKLWFGKSHGNDQAVIERFDDTLAAAAADKLDHWAATPRGRLALVIVLDQFSHPIHRNPPQAFATHAKALALSLAAFDAGEPARLLPIERVFLYLPLEHAESLALQERAVCLFEALAREAGNDECAVFEDFLAYAIKHRDIVARFGRFPHRNAILARVSTPEETEFLKHPSSRF